MLQSKSKASFQFLMMFMIWLDLACLVSDVALQGKKKQQSEAAEKNGTIFRLN